MSSLAILIPVFNSAKTIEKCLRSAINFTSLFDITKVLVSDNNSTDGTKNILERYEAHANIFYQEKNIGMTENFKFLVNTADTSHVLILGADDYLEQHSRINIVLNATGSEAILFKTQRVDASGMHHDHYLPSQSLKKGSVLERSILSHEKINLLIGSSIASRAIWQEFLSLANFARGASIDRIFVYFLINSIDNISISSDVSYVKQIGTIRCDQASSDEGGADVKLYAKIRRKISHRYEVIMISSSSMKKICYRLLKHGRISWLASNLMIFSWFKYISLMSIKDLLSAPRKN